MDIVNSNLGAGPDPGNRTWFSSLNRKLAPYSTKDSIWQRPCQKRLLHTFNIAHSFLKSRMNARFKVTDKSVRHSSWRGSHKCLRASDLVNSILQEDSLPAESTCFSHTHQVFVTYETQETAATSWAKVLLDDGWQEKISQSGLAFCRFPRKSIKQVYEFPSWKVCPQNFCV